MCVRGGRGKLFFVVIVVIAVCSVFFNCFYDVGVHLTLEKLKKRKREYGLCWICILRVNLMHLRFLSWEH